MRKSENKCIFSFLITLLMWALPLAVYDDFIPVWVVVVSILTSLFFYVTFLLTLPAFIERYIDPLIDKYMKD